MTMKTLILIVLLTVIVSVVGRGRVAQQNCTNSDMYWTSQRPTRGRGRRMVADTVDACQKACTLYSLENCNSVTFDSEKNICRRYAFNRMSRNIVTYTRFKCPPGTGDD